MKGRDLAYEFYHLYELREMWLGTDTENVALNQLTWLRQRRVVKAFLKTGVR